MDDNNIIVKVENLGYDNTVDKMIVVAKICLSIWQRLVHVT